MAQALSWSNEALDDVDRIAEYISRDSRHHAQQVVERLFDLADELPAHPRLGRIVPELADPNVRERFLYSYRLIYEIKVGQGGNVVCAQASIWRGKPAGWAE